MESLNQPTAKRWRLGLLSVFFVFILSTPSFPQSPTRTKPKTEAKPTTEKTFLTNLLKDQKGIWTAPFHWDQSDVKWVAPLGLSMAALIATDRHTSGELIENGDNLDRLRISKDISYSGSFYSTGGVAAAFYLAGRIRHDERARETGLLSAEALLNAQIVAQALKATSQRQRPPIDNSSGEFFDGGSSFPSGHAISAWSVATVIAQEYGPRHPAIRYGAYALATAIGISRYTARKHFLSDVVAGSAMGYGIGKFVYHQHHDTSLDVETKKQTSRLFKSNFFPDVLPTYNRREHLYGASLAWNF